MASPALCRARDLSLAACVRRYHRSIYALLSLGRDAGTSGSEGCRSGMCDHPEIRWSALDLLIFGICRGGRKCSFLASFLGGLVLSKGAVINHQPRVLDRAEASCVFLWSRAPLLAPIRELAPSNRRKQFLAPSLPRHCSLSSLTECRGHRSFAKPSTMTFQRNTPCLIPLASSEFA